MSASSDQKNEAPEIEVTAEMMAAGIEAYRYLGRDEDPDEQVVREIYEAMVAARELGRKTAE